MQLNLWNNKNHLLLPTSMCICMIIYLVYLYPFCFLLFPVSLQRSLEWNKSINSNIMALIRFFWTLWVNFRHAFSIRCEKVLVSVWKMVINALKSWIIDTRWVFVFFCILISKYNRVKTFGHEIKWSIMLYCS